MLRRASKQRETWRGSAQAWARSAATAVTFKDHENCEQRPQQRNAEKGNRQANQKGDIQPLHQQHGEVAADHGEGAMRQVDEIHQPHGHGQADGQDEQEHPVGDAVEEDGQHGEGLLSCRT